MTTPAQLDEEQVQRSAEALVRTHGEAATEICAQTSQRWHERGDHEAARLWKRFMLACRQVLSELPTSTGRGASYTGDPGEETDDVKA